MTTGIDASTMMSLGTCRFVIPLSESTIASAGRFLYTAWMSASISARFASGNFFIFAYRSPRPLLALTPSSFNTAACFSKTSL